MKSSIALSWCHVNLIRSKITRQFQFIHLFVSAWVPSTLFVYLCSRFCFLVSLTSSVSCRSSKRLLMSCLRCWSSGSPCCLSQSPPCIYLNYTCILSNNISPNGHVVHQTPKSKLNVPRVIFPYMCSHTKQNSIFWYKQSFLLHLNLESNKN